MFAEKPLRLDDLIDCPGALKVLLALAEVDQAYQFQLTRKTGHHSRTLNNALQLLIEARMVKIVAGKVRIRNTGDFYALTTHGRVITKGLQDVAKSLQTAQNSKG